MKHNLTLYKEIARQLSAGCGYTIIFLILLTVYHSEDIQLSFFVGIPSILAVFLAIERYCDRIVLYLLLHGLCFLPFIAIEGLDPYYRALYLFLLGAESLRALHVWSYGMDKPYTEPPWHMLIACGICCITARRCQLPEVEVYAYCIAVLILAIHFVRLYLNGLTSLIAHSGYVTSIPVRKIMQGYLALFALFLLVFFLLAACNPFFGLEQAFYTVGDFLVKCIRVIGRFLLAIIAILRALTARETTLEDVREPVRNLVSAARETAAPSLILELLATLLDFLFIIMIIVLFYRLCTKLIKRYLTAHTADTDIVMPLEQENGIFQAEKTASRSAKRKKKLSGKTYNERVRLAYRLRIQSFKGIHLLPSDTAKDIAEKIHTTYEENIDALTNVYEKARYSEETVTPDEAKEGGIVC